jgi:thymidine kinase
MSLSVYVGCQSSGKSISNIIESTKWLDVLDKRGLYINSKIDTRDLKNIISSNSSSYKGVSDKFDIIKVDNLEECKFLVNLDSYDVISIDEIQFFPDLEKFVKYLLHKNKHIICSGLDSNWLGEDFGQVMNLLKMSTHFEKLHAKCLICKNELGQSNIHLISDATRTGKISGSEEKIEIGGKSIYVPMCITHHIEHLKTIHGIEIDEEGDLILPIKKEVKKRKFSEDYISDFSEESDETEKTEESEESDNFGGFYNNSWHCVNCNEDLGESNPRQYCCKTYCPFPVSKKMRRK